MMYRMSFPRTSLATITLVLLTVLSFSSCKEPKVEQTIALDQTVEVLEEGTTTQLKATATPDGTISWRSNDPTIATVTSSGLVSAIKKGETQIIASIGDAQASCRLIVTSVQGQKITLTLDKAALKLKVGEKGIIKAETNSTKPITWTSSEPSIASISNQGEVLGIKEGMAIITAEVENVRAQCIVTIEKAENTEKNIELVSKKIVMENGAKGCGVFLYSAPNFATVKFESHNKDIADYDAVYNADGTIQIQTGVWPEKEGTARFTVSNEGQSQDFEIEVVSPAAFKLSYPSPNLQWGMTREEVTAHEAKLGHSPYPEYLEESTNQWLFFKTNDPHFPVVLYSFDVNGKHNQVSYIVFAIRYVTDPMGLKPRFKEYMTGLGFDYVSTEANMQTWKSPAARSKMYTSMVLVNRMQYASINFLYD